MGTGQLRPCWSSSGIQAEGSLHLEATHPWLRETRGSPRKMPGAVVHVHSGALDDGAGKPLQRRGREPHVMGGWSGNSRA